MSTLMMCISVCFFFFQAEDGIRDLVRSRGLGDVYKRQSQGMTVKVIDVAWLYDQFNAGVLDPQAIKNFIDYTYHQWAGPAPSFVLLVGDANFNPMGYNPSYYGPWEQTYVPTFNLVIDPYTGEVAVDNEFVTVSGNDILPDPVSYTHLTLPTSDLV